MIVCWQLRIPGVVSGAALAALASPSPSLRLSVSVVPGRGKLVIQANGGRANI